MLGHLAAATDIYVRLNGDPFTSPHYIFSYSSGGASEQVTLVKGSTYTFIRTDDGHAFNIGDAWKQPNTEITVVSTGSGGAVGAGAAAAASIVNGEELTVTIPSDFSGDTLTYFCYAHSGMIGTFNVVPAADFSGAFDGTTVDGNTFTFPSGAENYAGFSNDNTGLYPLRFTEAGSITFMGSVASGGSADVRFRLEYNPYPNVDPAYDTAFVTVSGATPTGYTVEIPQQGENTFSSLVMFIVERDVAVTITDVGVNGEIAVGGSDGGSDSVCDNSVNLVTDGTFDEITPTTWSGNAYNPVGGVNQANVGTAGNPWDVNLQQSVTLVSGADYTLSFDVSGDGRTMVAGIGQSSSPHLNHAPTVYVGASSQTIVMHLSAKSDGVGQGFGGGNMRVFFDMGADTGSVNIDNVELICGHTGTENLGDTGDTGNVNTDYSLPDEYSTVDSSKWFHQTQLPDGGTWFNNERQHYTDEDANSYVSGGTLKIVAKKETYTDQLVTKQYTSARLNSKFAFTYGVVEVRAKLPTGKGTWPAIWTLGKNINEAGAYWQTQGFGTTAWPACGEIDIMEHWGTNQNVVQSALHTLSSSGATINYGGQSIGTVSSHLHTYSMDWDADRIIFAVDGVVHYEYNPTVKDDLTWPFNAPQFLLLNVAIASDISSSFVESAMEIDYVRVFQKNGDDYEIVWRDEFGDQEDIETPWDGSDYVTPTKYDVTFQVDMTYIDVVPEGVHLSGGDFGNPGSAMTDDDGDNTWTVTLSLDPGTYKYKFRNYRSPSPTDYTNFEQGADSIVLENCGTGQYWDRYFTLTNQDIVLDVVPYGYCNYADAANDGSVDVDQLQRDCASGTSASCSALLLQCTC